jgi:periplasmic divalent cation tolerance protein
MIYRLVLSTIPPDKAPELARTLVAERLAACVNLLPGARSFYRWKGEACEDDEALLLIKTTAAALPRLTERLLALHPYDVPEVVALPIAAGEGHGPYLDWIGENVD